MWILIIVVVLIVACWLVKRVLDSETLNNLSFLVKILFLIFGLFILLGLILAISQL